MECLDEGERYRNGNLPRDFALGVLAVEATGGVLEENDQTDD